MCTLPIFSVVKSSLFIRALLLDRILAAEKTARKPHVHLVTVTAIIMLERRLFRGLFLPTPPPHQEVIDAVYVGLFLELLIITMYSSFENTTYKGHYSHF